jgi:peptidyl-dipeptidase A
MMTTVSTEIEQLFTTHRAELDGKKMSNNAMLEALSLENDSAKRKRLWEGLKQVGEEVGPRLVNLAKLRNRAAKQLGFATYWEMQIQLQEHDPEQILDIFADIETRTNEPYRRIKKEIDEEAARRFDIGVDDVMPWHYDNPFFQEAPPSEEVNLDAFYKGKAKEEIMQIAERFYADIGLPCDAITGRSDLYEREGKDQHAFCITIDRGDDVRTLLNIKPTSNWMETALHEEGHAVYYLDIEKNLPFNLREAAHIFTTEAVAMLMGALGKNPTWIVHYAGAKETRVKELEDAILEQRRREQLIFARWAMVMLHFEKAFYENPTKDLNTLWWGFVERFQMIPRPEGRNEPDWASKPHFTIAPVYYHNYLLGEVFAAQIRHTLASIAKHDGPVATLNWAGRTDFGQFLKDKIFKPGMSLPWPEFVTSATNEELNAKYFGSEVTVSIETTATDKRSSP